MERSSEASFQVLTLVPDIAKTAGEKSELDDTCVVLTEMSRSRTDGPEADLHV
jgi:hypothetical protein